VETRPSRAPLAALIALFILGNTGIAR